MFLLRWLMVPMVLIVTSLAQAGPVRIIGDPARDARQTIQARKLLADDPDLSAWNVGVTVHDRVATLWGPVPTAEIAFRAELALKTMIELREVRSELFLSDQLKPMRVPLKIDNPPLLTPDQLPPALPKGPRLLPPLRDFSREPSGTDPFQPKTFRNATTQID